MRADYNPFTRKQYEKTEHGIINYTHAMGTTYITHRRAEHYFKKYQGYAISNSEIEIAQQKGVIWIVILYHRKRGGTIPYRIRLKHIKQMEEYNNEGDIQKVIPLKYMQTKKEGEWMMT